MAFHFGKKKQVEKVEVPPTQEADREVKEVVTVEKEKVNSVKTLSLNTDRLLLI